jgi:hypothetical protein
MKWIITAVTLAACAATGQTGWVDNLIYSETFDTGNQKGPLTWLNWTANHGDAGESFFPVPSGYATEASPYLATYGCILDNLPGPDVRSNRWSGADNKLVWSENIGTCSVDVARVSLVGFRLDRQVGVRPALQVEGGTTWFITHDVFPVTGNNKVLSAPRTAWDALYFEPGVSMVVGDATNLPPSGRVTAIGFFYRNCETNDAPPNDLYLDNVIVEARGEAPGLIAAESFWTTAGGGAVYQDTKNYGVSEPNSAVSLGNVGFDGTLWTNANNRVQPTSTVSLSHPGVTGVSRPGCTWLHIKGLHETSYRYSVRPLAVEPPATNVYWLSGLIRVDALDLLDGEFVSAGFDNILQASPNQYVNLLTNGFHFGVSKTDGHTSLTAFAGDQKFHLREVDGFGTGVVWQVVLKLDADAHGEDALTAWIARDDVEGLTRILKCAPVETFAGPASLRSLRLNTRHAERDMRDENAATKIYVDEIRFGTSREVVTTLVESPPGGTVISVR